MRLNELKWYKQGGPAPNATGPVIGSNLAGFPDNQNAAIPAFSLPPITAAPLSPPPRAGRGPVAPKGASLGTDNVVVWPYGVGADPPNAIGVATDTSYFTAAQVGDSVPPRPSPTPPGVGTTFTSFGAVAAAGNYAGFIGNGQDFSGIYAKNLSDGILRTVAEGLGLGNPYGQIYEVFFHGATEVIFRCDTGIYRGDAEGATTPAPVITNSQPLIGVLTDLDGDLAAVVDTDLLRVNLAAETQQRVVRVGDLIPGSGSGETFGLLQRAAISPAMMVFEGFNQNLEYAGLFAWVNGTVLPIVRPGQMLDGRTVQTLGFQAAAVDANAMAFTAYFDDGTAATYLARIGATQLVGAASRKTHGVAGAFDIALPLAGIPGVECRTGGANGNHTIIFGFTHSVVGGDASVTGGTGTVVATPSFSDNTMTVELTGVADAQAVTLSLKNVTDGNANVLPTFTLTFDVLLGDTNGNGTVSSSDISQTKSQSGAPVTAANAREDLNANGTISSSDIALVKSRSGSSVFPRGEVR